MFLGKPESVYDFWRSWEGQVPPTLLWFLPGSHREYMIWIVYLLPNPGLCPEVCGLPVLEGV